MRLVALFAWLAVLCALSGCEPGRQPDLVELSAIGPAQVSAGDRIQLTGSGLPEGKEATVLFRGTIHRPGVAPLQGQEIVASGRSVADDRMEIAVDRDLEEAFTQEGLAAEHATFRGTVRVIFDSNVDDAPRVTGTLVEATLDVMPSSLAVEVVEARRRAGQDILDALGLRLAPIKAGSWSVESVAPDSRGARAGVEPDDRLIEIGGVRITGPSDFRLRPGREVTTLRVEREGYSEPVPLVLDVSELSPPALVRLGPAAAILLGLGALFGVFSGSLPSVIAWTERRAIVTKRATAGPRRPRRLRDLLEDVLAPPSGARGIGRCAPHVTFVAVAAGFGIGAVGMRPFGTGAHLAAVTGLPLIALSVCRLVDHGRGAPRGWSLRRGLVGVMTALSGIFAVALAILGLVGATGAVGLSDLAASQGGAPWQWHAFTNPGLLVLAIVVLLSAVPDSEAMGATLAEADLPRPGPSTHSLTRYGEWLYLWAASGLVAAGFLGGWQLPGVREGTVVVHPWIQIIGVLLFCLKLLFCAFCTVTLRWAASGIGSDVAVGFAWRRLIVRAAVAAALAVGWAWMMSHAPVNLALLVGGTIGAMLLVIVAVWAYRLRAALSAGAEASVNPWL